MTARLHREDSGLRLEGRLDRAAATVLWPQAVAVAGGAQVLDIGSVETVDSAGMALLLALAQRMGGARVVGAPQGFADLLAAYRLAPDLSFDSDHQ